MRAYLLLAVSFILMALMGIVFAADGAGPSPGEYGEVGSDGMRSLQRNFNGRIGSRLTALHEDDVDAADMDPDAEALADAFAPDTGCPVRNRVDRVWLGAFGATSRRSNTGAGVGYRYETSGLVMGYDWEHSGDVSLGASVSFGTGDLDSHDSRAVTDVDTLNLGMYASYDPVGGMFADASVNYGFSRNRAIITAPGGVREGRFNTHAIGMGGNVGYIFDLDSGYRITPTLGIQWTHLHQNGWSENASGAGVVAQWYEGSDENWLEVPLMVRVNRSFQLGNGMILTPEVRAAVVFDIGPERAAVRTGFVGGSESTILHGTDAGKTRKLVGAGVKANLTNTIDAFMDYNHEFASGYRNSNLTGGVGVSF